MEINFLRQCCRIFKRARVRNEQIRDIINSEVTIIDYIEWMVNTDQIEYGAGPHQPREKEHGQKLTGKGLTRVNGDQRTNNRGCTE